MNATTPLGARLAERIARSGPIDVADYFTACLSDPDHGYYRRKPAIGTSGDFITAPEISQVFGELIGLWCAVVWQQMGEPDRVRLVELGPGRGTLLRDALRAARLVPDFHAALAVELVEINEHLVAEQRAALGDHEVPVRWTQTLQPGAYAAIVIANEFLDTLPVTQYVFHDGSWHGRRVGLDTRGNLAFVRGPREDPPRLPPTPPREGDILEGRDAVLDGFAGALSTAGSPLAALFVDYGHAAHGVGDTLQAITAQRYADPLAAPGGCDLTAQVDFAAVADVMRRHGLACDGPVTQGEFLGRLGIVERASRLMASNASRAAGIEADVARLIAPGGMGARFLALGVRTSGLQALPGLDPVDSGNAAT